MRPVLLIFLNLAPLTFSSHSPRQKRDFDNISSSSEEVKEPALALENDFDDEELPIFKCRRGDDVEVSVSASPSRRKRDYGTVSSEENESLGSRSEAVAEIEDFETSHAYKYRIYDSSTELQKTEDVKDDVPNNTEELPMPSAEFADYKEDYDLIKWWGASEAFRTYFSKFATSHLQPYYLFDGTDPYGQDRKRLFRFFYNVAGEEKRSMSPLRVLVYREFFHHLFGAGDGCPFIHELIEEGLIDLSQPVYEDTFLHSIRPEGTYIKDGPLTFYRRTTFAHLIFDHDCLEPFIYQLILPKLSSTDFNEKSWNGKTLLHLAIESNNDEVIDYLLNNGADPRIINLPIEGNAAMMAARRQDLKLLQRIAETGQCDPDVVLQSNFSLSRYFFQYRIPEALLVYVHWKGYSTEKLISKLYDLLMIAYRANRAFGLSCLKMILTFRHLEALFLKLLPDFVMKGGKGSFDAVVCAGYQPLTSFKIGGRNETYLHLAIRFNQTHMIASIMNSVNADDQLSFEGLTPAKLAITKKNLVALKEIVALLQDRTVLVELLIHAAHVGFELGVAHLVKYFESIQHVSFGDNSLPVYFSQYGSQRMLWACLSNANYDPYIADPKGVVLATVRCDDPVKQSFIEQYVETYDSLMQI